MNTLQMNTAEQNLLMISELTVFGSQ